MRRTVGTEKSIRTALALLITLLLVSASGAEEIVDGIAAQVGSEIVLISDVYQIAEPPERRLREQGASEKEIAMLRAEILERMIERALIRQVVRRAELDATEAEVDTAIGNIASENGLTMEQLRASVEAQGLPFEAYRERIRGEIEHAKVINGMIGARVRVDEKDVRALYDQEYGDQPAGGTEVHLRHILVPFDSEDPAARRRACAQTRKALVRIRGGEPFQDVAAEVSTVKPEKGGDIGWFHSSSLAPWMREAIDPLSNGGTSDVIEMPFGCNLLHVDEKRAYEQIAYEDVHDRLAEYLYQMRLGEEYSAFIDELREKTFIERKGIFADAARLGDGKDTGADELDLGLGNDTF
jgi:parvulin-like peptidyl-prolyl isomerase